MAAMGNMPHHARNSSDPQIPGAEAFRPNPAGPYGDPYGQRPAAAIRGPGGPGGPMGLNDDFARSGGPPPPLDGMRNLQTPEPVSRPPAFSHGPQARPAAKPYHSPELRKANSRLSNSTLSQLVGAATEGHPNGPPDMYSNMRAGGHNAPIAQPSVPTLANHPMGMHANDGGSREALTSPPSGSRAPPPFPPPLNPQRSRSPMQPGYGPPGPGPRSPLPPQPPSRSGPPNDGQMRPPQASFNNFSRPDGARTPPIGGPGRVPTPEMRGRPGYGPPSPLPGGPQPPAFQNSRPQTPNDERGGPRGPMLSPLNTSPPINRKPLGGRPDEIQTASSGGSFNSNVMNQAGLGQVRPLDPRRERTPQPEQQIHRQFSERSGASSRYEDASSATTPDYASTHRSDETQESMDRPRAGVLKTVGGGEPPMPQKPNLAGYDLPDVNFGPTVNYGANPRKKTPQPVAPGGPRPYSPALRSPPPTGGQDPFDAGPRQVAWQPGAAHAPSGQGMSAEQYVQTRAAMGGHSRTPSGQLLNSARSQTPSPSMGRSNSQELLSNHQRRKSSVDLLSRPGSRGANHALDQGSSGDAASHLSAREQEQIARMTGGPLISMGGGRGQPQNQPGGGLVGAIDAREREKQQMKQGLNSQAVQHAIHQRQQQQYQQQMQQQQAMYPPNMGRGGPPPGPYGQPRPQQPPYGAPMSPGHGAFPRGPMPMRPAGAPPSPGLAGPQGFMPPQAQYGAPPRPQSPGGAYGRGGTPQGPPQGRPPYHGQAF